MVCHCRCTHFITTFLPLAIYSPRRAGFSYSFRPSSVYHPEREDNSPLSTIPFSLTPEVASFKEQKEK